MKSSSFWEQNNKLIVILFSIFVIGLILTLWSGMFFYGFFLNDEFREIAHVDHEFLNGSRETINAMLTSGVQYSVVAKFSSSEYASDSWKMLVNIRKDDVRISYLNYELTNFEPSFVSSNGYYFHDLGTFSVDQTGDYTIEVIVIWMHVSEPIGGEAIVYEGVLSDDLLFHFLAGFFGFIVCNIAVLPIVFAFISYRSTRTIYDGQGRLYMGERVVEQKSINENHESIQLHPKDPNTSEIPIGKIRCTFCGSINHQKSNHCRICGEELDEIAQEIIFE